MIELEDPMINICLSHITQNSDIDTITNHMITKNGLKNVFAVLFVPRKHPVRDM